ncbi:MAG: hypothetical protein COB04_13405 [Gammaproteobacteria bacterium]|nr:MAG: hypothetical protein COB04_13405 [Gammaproteobacteria bacterium]
MKLFRSLNSYHGFTLVELLVVLTISTILLSVAAPFFGTFAREGEANANFNQIFRSIQLARSTAINEGTFVSVCPTNDNLANNAVNSINCSASGTFFVAFRDLDQNGVLDTNDANPFNLGVIQFSSLGGTGTSRTTNDPNNPAIIFQPDGNTFNGVNAGTIYYCAAHLELDQQIRQSAVISTTGRARTGDWSNDAFDGDPCAA